MTTSNTNNATTDTFDANTGEVFFDYLQSDNAGGFENMTADTCAMPFIRVLQDLSPQCKPSKPEYIEGAMPGMFYNTINHRLISSPIQVIVGKFDRYFIEWKPARGGFVTAHSVAEIQKSLSERNGMCVYDNSNKLYMHNGNLLQDTYVYFIVFPKYLEDGVCLLCLTSTALKTARRWNNMLLNTVLPGTLTPAQPYHMLWNISSGLQTNDKGEWWGLSVNFDGFVNREQFAYITQKRQQLAVQSSIDLQGLEGSVIDIKELEESKGNRNANDYSQF